MLTTPHVNRAMTGLGTPALRSDRTAEEILTTPVTQQYTFDNMCNTINLCCTVAVILRSLYISWFSSFCFTAGSICLLFGLRCRPAGEISTQNLHIASYTTYRVKDTYCNSIVQFSESHAHLDKSSHCG